jgi:AcrR family transcriptional regulator
VSEVAPLRARQAELNRQVILDSVVNLLEANETDGVSMQEIARESGVSLRTLYRYFPTRRELLAESGVHIRQRMGLIDEVGSADEVPASFWANSARAAEHPGLARALLATSIGRLAREGTRSKRVAAIKSAMRELTTDLPEARARQVIGVITHLCSSSSWVAISDESGVSALDARRGVVWALETLIADLRNEAQHAPRSNSSPVIER